MKLQKAYSRVEIHSHAGFSHACMHARLKEKDLGRLVEVCRVAHIAKFAAQLHAREVIPDNCHGSTIKTTTLIDKCMSVWNQELTHCIIGHINRQDWLWFVTIWRSSIYAPLDEQFRPMIDNIQSNCNWPRTFIYTDTYIFTLNNLITKST